MKVIFSPFNFFYPCLSIIMHMKQTLWTSYKLVCFATAEPDASELLTLDEDLVAMSATSVLNVDVAIAASGSESEYLMLIPFFELSTSFSALYLTSTLQTSFFFIE